MSSCQIFSDSVNLFIYYLLCSLSFVSPVSIFLFFLCAIYASCQKKFRMSNKAKQTLVKFESGKSKTSCSFAHCLPVFFPPNWSNNLNFSPIGGFAVQLNLTLSNNLPAAVMRCTWKYLWLPNIFPLVLTVNLFYSFLFLLREVNCLSLLLGITL